MIVHWINNTFRKVREWYWHRQLRRLILAEDISHKERYRVAMQYSLKCLSGSRLQGDCYEVIADYWRINGDYPKALNNYYKAISIYKTWPDQKRALASLFMQLAFLHETYHHYEKALGAYEEANQLALQDTDGQTRLDILILKVGIYEDMRAYDQGEELLNTVIALSLEYRLYRNMAAVYGRLGTLFEEQARNKDAEEAYLKGMEWLDQADDQLKVEVRLWGSLLDLYRRTQNSDSLKTTIAYIDANSELAGHPDIKYFLLHYYIDSRAFQKARQLLDDLEQYYLDRQQFKKLLFLYGISLHYFKQSRDWKTGKLFFKKALQLIDNKQLWSLEWSLFHLYGELLEASEGSHAALSMFAHAARALETYRDQVPDAFDRIDFFEDKLSYYWHYCFSAISCGRNEEAFHYLEMSKSKTLIDLLSADKPIGYLDIHKLRAML